MSTYKYSKLEHKKEKTAYAASECKKVKEEKKQNLFLAYFILTFICEMGF